MCAHDLHELGSKLDVSAKPLEGRGGGADTHFNALQDSREHTSFILCSCLKFASWPTFLGTLIHSHCLSCNRNVCW